MAGFRVLYGRGNPFSDPCWECRPTADLSDYSNEPYWSWLHLQVRRRRRPYEVVAEEVRELLVALKRLTLDPVSDAGRKLTDNILAAANQVVVTPEGYRIEYEQESASGSLEELAPRPGEHGPLPQNEEEWIAWFSGTYMPAPERDQAVTYLRSRLTPAHRARLRGELAGPRIEWAVEHNHTIGEVVRRMLQEGGFSRRSLYLYGVWAELLEAAIADEE